MRDSAIQHLAVAQKGSIVAAALSETTVQFWSVSKEEQIGQAETVLDGGGKRLALTSDGTVCIAGSWLYGISAYTVPDGKTLWSRKALTKVHFIDVSMSSDKLFCGFDSGSVLALEVRTGKVVEDLKRTKRVIQSQTGSQRVVVRKDEYLVQSSHEFKVPALSFTIWDAAFSSEAVCISEPDAEIRCLELSTGKLLWHHRSLESDRLAFNAADKRFYAVALRSSSSYQGSLIRLAPSLLQCDQVADINSCDGSFDPTGTVLVTMRGDVYETSTGRIIANLEFPQCDYPDS